MSTTTHEAPTHGRMDSPISGLQAIPHIPICYDIADHDKSALRLVQEYSPEWRNHDSHIRFKRFTEGITNTLTKATMELPGKTDTEIDKDAILLRAYGKGTDVIIDRQREMSAHSLLASRGLAPPLLARFENGLMYRFVEGDVCTPEDLRKPEVYRQVAKRLGEWHGSLPISAVSSFPSLDGKMMPGQKSAQAKESIPMPIPTPNTWTVISDWISALPVETNEQAQQQIMLSAELDDIVAKYNETPGLFGKSYVFSHCDLLSGNVIIERHVPGSDDETSPEERTVSFIDYEYSTPSPAAFDIANHFAEWAGLDCDHASVPTKGQRRDFLKHYVASFYFNAISEGDNLAMEIDMRAAIDQLYNQVDEFRGIPGFYWGIWALIQANISQIDFDYAKFAETRLGEYWSWKAEKDGSRAKEGREMPLRERRWAEE